MKIVRTHRSLIAWMLYGLILLNGLICSISHGQMLGAFSRPSSMGFCAEHQASAHAASPSKTMDHSLAMKSGYGDCSFAATLALAIVFFIALAWLIRLSRSDLRVPESLRKKPPRQTFPGLNPQAP